MTSGDVADAPCLSLDWQCRRDAVSILTWPTACLNRFFAFDPSRMRKPTRGWTCVIFLAGYLPRPHFGVRCARGPSI